MRVALTGNIASGKSAVAKIISEYYMIHDADKIYHEMLENNSRMIRALMEYFGTRIATSKYVPMWLDTTRMLGKQLFELEWTIDRKKLAETVFKLDELEALNKITQDYILNEISYRIYPYKNCKQHVFVEVPLYYEHGVDKIEDLFDKVIMVTTSRENQISNLMARNKITRQEAEKRMVCFMDPSLKHPDIIIQNNGTFEQLRADTVKIVENYFI